MTNPSRENAQASGYAPVSRTEELKMEIRYLSVQCTTMFEAIGRKIESIESRIASPKDIVEAVKKETGMLARQTVAAYESVKAEVDKIGREVSYLSQQNFSVYNMTTSYIEHALTEAEKRIGEKVDGAVKEAPAVDFVVDYEKIADEVAARLTSPAASEEETQPATEEVEDKSEEFVVDYDALAEKIVENTPPIDYDYLAGKIVEKNLVDYDAISSAVAEKIADVLPSSDSELTQEGVADCVISKLQEVPVEVDVQSLADSVVERIQMPSMAIDTDELADAVASRIVLPEAEVPEINVDEVAEAVAAKIVVPAVDEETLSSAVAEKVVFDYDALAEKIAVPAVDEETLSSAVAEKVVFDYDALAEKILASLPAIDYDEVSEKLAEKLNGDEEEAEALLSESAQEEEGPSESERVITAVEENGEKTNELVNEVIRLLKEKEFVAVVEPEEKPVQELVPEPEEEEEPVEEKASEPVGEAPQEVVVAEAAAEEGEAEESGEKAVRLKRSFECKIRQSEEEVKYFYSVLKNEMLSYGKVHSTLSWNGDRYNFGRETVAKVVVNGKTLCLYLALDPDKYPVTKYHQKDVGGVKAYEGTPMMVKIKSGMGLKKALTLVYEMMEGLQAQRVERENEDFAAVYAYKSDEELLAEGLIKATLTEKKDLTSF